MSNEYNYYIKRIKPIEKKYNRLCILSSILKFKWLINQKLYYNKILINYYKTLQKDTKYTSRLKKHIIK